MNATMTKSLTEMTTEHAGYILRNWPETAWEATLARHAVGVLAKAGESLYAIEMIAMRSLSADERKAYDEAAK